MKATFDLDLKNLILHDFAGFLPHKELQYRDRSSREKQPPASITDCCLRCPR